MTFPGSEGSKGYERFEDIDGILVYHTAGLLTTFFGLPLFQRLMRIAGWRNRITRLAMRLAGREPLLFSLPTLAASVYQFEIPRLTESLPDPF